MINELYALYQCLQKCGIPIGSPHQFIESPGKSEGFIVGINIDGLPETLQPVTAEKMARLWTSRKGNHHSFPFVKKPVFKLSIEDSLYREFKGKKKYEEKLKLLTAILIDQYEKQDFSLSLWTKDRLAEIYGKDIKLQALLDLADRMPQNAEVSTRFSEKLLQLILQNIDETTIDTAKSILIGDLNERSKKVECNASLFFDVSNWEAYQCRVASPEMGMLVRQYLPKVGANDQGDDVSAFGGRGISDVPYPKRKFGPAGSVYFFSMNENAPCHKRYGKISSSIFPTTSDERQAIDGALEWCVADERKGKTWRGVPNIKRKQDLVIAYLEEKPLAEIELASAFTAFDVSESEIAAAVYEEKSKKVCDAFRAERGLNADSKTNFLVITKVDEGRAQVVLSGSYKVGNIVNSIEQWQIASKNRPHFSVFLPGKKGEKAVIAEPFCPSPEDVMRCFQNQWIRNGLDKSDVPGVHLRHVYDLFLGEGHIAQETARMFLQLVLQRLGPLLLGIAGADHAGDVKEYSVDARKTVLVGI